MNKSCLNLAIKNDHKKYGMFDGHSTCEFRMHPSNASTFSNPHPSIVTCFENGHETVSEGCGPIIPNGNRWNFSAEHRTTLKASDVGPDFWLRKLLKGNICMNYQGSNSSSLRINDSITICRGNTEN